MVQTGRSRNILIPYIILAVLFLLHLLPMAFKDARMWGFNHLIFLPPWYSILFVLAGGFALTMPFLPINEKWSRGAVSWFAATFFESAHKYIWRLLLVLSAGGIFASFPMPTHFLGDGYSLLNNIGSSTGAFVKWTERGITMILMAVQSVLGGPSQAAALGAYRIVAIFSGLVTIWFYFLIAQISSQDNHIRFLLFWGCMLSGALLLYFGYVENYPLLWPAVTGFIYFSLRHIQNGGGIYPAALCLAFGLFIHLQFAVFVPAMIFLLFSRDRGLNIYRRHGRFLWGGAVAAALLGAAAFVHKYSTDLYFESIFLPLIQGRVQWPGYLLISLPHLLDLLNLLLLLSPALPLWLYFARGGWRDGFKRKEMIFLFLVAAGGMSFAMLVDPRLGMARDWDLFSLSGLGLTLLCIAMISPTTVGAVKRLSLSLVLILGAAVLPFILLNLGEATSLKYARSLIRLDRGKSSSAFGAIQEYYVRKGDSAGADAVGREHYTMYPDRFWLDQAVGAARQGQTDLARQLLSRIRADKFDARYHDLLGALYFAEGQYEQSLRENDRALQLQQYNYQYLYSRALVLRELGRHEQALLSLQTAYALRQNDLDLLYLMARLYYDLRRFDSAAFYGEKMIQVDSASPESFYFLARIHIAAGNPAAAREAYAGYERLGMADSLFEIHSASLRRKIDSLEGILH